MIRRLLLIAIFFTNISSKKLHGWDMEDFGDIGQYALPLSAFALSLATQDYKGSAEFAEEFSLTMGIVCVLKPLLNQPRPNQGKWSFPSGHTASAFTGAAYIQRKYGWVYGVPAYIAAAGVGYSRVEAKKHWIRDVCAGAAIAVSSNYFFNDPSQNLVVAPYYDGESGGLSFQLTW